MSKPTISINLQTHDLLCNIEGNYNNQASLNNYLNMVQDYMQNEFFEYDVVCNHSHKEAIFIYTKEDPINNQDWLEDEVAGFLEKTCCNVFSNMFDSWIVEN